MVNPTSVFLGFTFFGAGMAKLYFEHKFFGWIGPVWLEERLEPYGLAFYARFIAYSQVVIGYLLLTLRFRTLGAIMVVPLIANILIITISQSWKGTPFVVSALLIMAFYILYIDRKKLLGLIGIASGYQLNESLSKKGNLIWISGLVLNIVSIHLSVINLTAAWITSLVGVSLGYMSLWLEKDS